MNFLVMLFVGGLSYLALRSNQTGAPITQPITDLLSSGLSMGTITFATIGPNSDPRYWYDGVKPGTVTIGGQAPPQGWSPTADNLAGSTAAAGRTAGALTGSVAAIGSTGVFGTSGFSVAIGGALPFVGVALVGVVTVLSVIAAHHQAALAAEGKALNSADARMVNAMELVLQALLAGEITTIGQAQAMLNQIVADWYNQVKSVQRGVWHYTGQDLTADYQKVWIARTQPAAGAPGYSDYHAPDPCNGACVIGHFFTERNQILVLAAAADALAGNHGQLILPQIPPHDTQTGVPEVMVTY